MKDAPTFDGRLYTDLAPTGMLGSWVRRAEYDAAQDRIRALEAALFTINAICAQAPPCDELDEDGQTYYEILDSIQRIAKQHAEVKP